MREYCNGKAPSASHKAGPQDDAIISKKCEGNKLLKENVEQEEEKRIARAHKADDWDHIRGSAENPLIITWRPDLHLFLSSHPAYLGEKKGIQVYLREVVFVLV